MAATNVARAKTCIAMFRSSTTHNACQILGAKRRGAVSRPWLPIPVFSLLTALGAQISVPMTPVPMTLQSLVVVLSGLFLGWRYAAVAMGLYLAIGAAGLPVFSDGGSGLDALMGPTAGYLWSFPLAAAVAGLASSARGWRGAGLAMSAALVAHLMILCLGASWLMRSIGGTEALAVGFTPFLIGAVVKSALAVLAVVTLRRFRPVGTP